MSLLGWNINPVSANPTKWSNTLKQFVSNSRRIAWMFDHFVGLKLKGFKNSSDYLHFPEILTVPTVYIIITFLHLACYNFFVGETISRLDQM